MISNGQKIMIKQFDLEFLHRNVEMAEKEFLRLLRKEDNLCLLFNLLGKPLVKVEIYITEFSKQHRYKSPTFRVLSETSGHMRRNLGYLSIREIFTFLRKSLFYDFN